MPLIGDMGAYRVGDASVTALYAGDVKVWPLGPPEPDGTAHWDATGFELRLVVDNFDGYQQGRYVIAVPLLPGPVPNPTATLGQVGTSSTFSRMWWGSASSSAVLMQIQITNADAVAAWGGHLVAFTVNNSRVVTGVEVVG